MEGKKINLEKYRMEQRLFVEEKFYEIPRTGTIEIIPLYPKRLEHFQFKSYKGKDGLVYGMPLKTNNDGTYIFRTILVDGHKSYDLSNEDQAFEAAILINSPHCVDSPNANNKPKFKKFDRAEDARKELDKLRDARKAVDIALDLEGEELADFARILGITPEGNDAVVVHQLVSELASKKPRVFMESYEDMNRSVLQVLKRAEAVGLVKYSANTGYVYKDGMPLGGTESAAVRKLIDNKTLLNIMDGESKNKTSYSTGTPVNISSVKKEVVTKEIAKNIIEEEDEEEDLDTDEEGNSPTRANAFSNDNVTD